MQNPKTGGSRWVPDIRPENIDTYTETNTPEGGTEQSAEYKIVDAHPIIGGVLDKLAFFRTHASAVWYNKMKNITVLQKLDNLASNIGTLANLATTDKTSLVAAVNELNVKMKNIYRGFSFYRYGTAKYIDITVTEDGWYYAYMTTSNNPNSAPFMRFGIKNEYTFTSFSNTLGSYQYVTSPIIYMKSGDTMIAQGYSDLENGGLSVFFKKDVG